MPGVIAPESTTWLSEAIKAVADIRVDDPDRVVALAGQRKRRERFTIDGHLNIIAVDHPARRVTRVLNNELAMADRADYLARMVRILSANAADGVMATIDILEELLLLDSLGKEAGEASFLDGKLMIASLNRGGLAGASWEMEDPVTGPSISQCVTMGFDGVKLLLRLCDEEPASLKTMTACVQAINEASAEKLPVFLEPLPVRNIYGKYQVIKEPESLAKIVGVASALGDSSRYVWLKLPYCEGFETVAKATTLPIVLLGGESGGDADGFLSGLETGLAAGRNVRGTMVGRNVLYPPHETDPVAMARQVHQLVHQD